MKFPILLTAVFINLRNASTLDSPELETILDSYLICFASTSDESPPISLIDVIGKKIDKVENSGEIKYNNVVKKLYESGYRMVNVDIKTDLERRIEYVVFFEKPTS